MGFETAEGEESDEGWEVREEVVGEEESFEEGEDAREVGWESCVRLNADRGSERTHVLLSPTF